MLNQCCVHPSHYPTRTQAHCKGTCTPAQSLNFRMSAVSLVERLELKPAHGVLLPHYFVDNFDKVEQFQARPDDLLVPTYPKSGTTWVSEVIEMLYNNGDTDKCGRDILIKRIPFLELNVPGSETGVETLEKTPSPRVIKTHLPVQLVPASFWKNNCKMIYVARNPKDVAVSFYHFYKISKVHPEPGTWPEFLDKYIAGQVSYSSWFDHVKGWWEKAQKNPRVLYLFYEDMLEDPRREIRKVANFIGKDLTPELLEKTVYHTSFQQMKNNAKANFAGVHPLLVDIKIAPFMRKGVTGDWKNNFTVAQNEIIDAVYEKQMAGSTLRFRTEL